MMRRLHAAPVIAGLAGLAMTVGGLLGVGAEAATTTTTSSSHYALTKAADVYSGTVKVVRWAPCIRKSGTAHTHVIHYRVNTAGVSTRVRLVKQAIARLSTASGLTFQYDGRTSYIPHFDSTGHFAGAQEQRVTGVPFVVAWAYKGTGTKASNLLTATEAGVGTIAWKSSNLSQLRIVSAGVVMKRGVHLKSGFQAGGSVGTLLLHELGHAAGLQHVYTDNHQIMYPTLGSYSPSGYAAGDRTGLSKVGRPAGCMTTPSLAP
jgi:hypothetical protein